MKWFKHYSDSLEDPFIQALLDKFSHSGYVAYFGLIEIISKENGTTITGNLSISPAYLRRKLRSSQAKLRQVFEFCQTSGKLSVTFSKENWVFKFDKMLEIKDNYTKDLQVASKKPSNHKEVRVKSKIKNKNKESPLPPKGNGQIEFIELFPIEFQTSELFREEWKDWLQVRKEDRKAIKPTVAKKQMKFLSKYSVEVATGIVKLSADNGYTGLFEPKVKKETDEERSARELQELKEEYGQV